ncbi:MAG: glutathione S-transferase family protein [Sinobacteraceae bacterium]|nr:glutathione S-transferase family protein [Nevskiaceae bacterium]
MITLFHRSRTRASRFIFLLEELEAPYEIRTVTIRSRDGSGHIDEANPHPVGKVPAICDDGEVVFESPAIALYLTDKYRHKVLGPAVGERNRGAYVSWLCYYSGVLEPAFMSKFMGVEVPRGTAGWVPAEEAIGAVLKQLAGKSYLLGGDFSAADVLYATTFALFAGNPILPKNAVIEDYVRRVTTRAAFARAQAREAAHERGTAGD